MKTLALAAIAATLLAAPAFAAETTPSATTSAQPVSATALNPAKHVFEVGQRVPATYATNKFITYKPEELGLEKAGDGQRWYVVEGNAYLLNTDTNVVAKVAPVKAK